MINCSEGYTHKQNPRSYNVSAKLPKLAYFIFYHKIDFAMKRLVLLNAPILTSFGTFEFISVTIEEAQKFIREAETVESAIGHAATAEFMTNLLDYKVETNRVEFFQTVRDVALIFCLKKRIGEGRVLDAEEIEKIGYEFGLLKKLD